MVDPKDVKRENLVFTSDDKPGILREKFGKKFAYYDVDGKKIRDRKTLTRIDSLTIPPAWRHVWISPKISGHLQATGIDDRGRKQYIYHLDWVKVTQENKFAKVVDFGLSLPKIRDKVSYDMQGNTLDKKRILATIIWLLEKTFIRVGNEEYAESNNSFGLTTLRNRHASVRGDDVVFKFRGKSGVDSVIRFSNPRVAKTIKKCIELPGYELFQFVDEDGDRHVVDSSDVNEFLKEVANDDFSAKDFRTWGATNLSARNFYKLGAADDEKVVKQNIIATVKEVAHNLHNTVAVCRSYYIHPRVIDSYTDNSLIPHFDYYAKDKTQRRGLSWNEYALIKLLQK